MPARIVAVGQIDELGAAVGPVHWEVGVGRDAGITEAPLRADLGRAVAIEWWESTTSTLRSQIPSDWSVPTRGSTSSSASEMAWS